MQTQRGGEQVRKMAKEGKVENSLKKWGKIHSIRYKP
jgi:hypothetical protein